MHRENEWRQKLQGELEDEWQEVNGQLHNDASHEAQELESFLAWSDHLAREHAQKCQQQPEAKGAVHPPQNKGRRKSSGSLESEPRAKEEELHESQTSRPRSRHRRLTGTQSPGLSTPDKQGGAASGTLTTCPGPALGERTGRPWLQP